MGRFFRLVHGSDEFLTAAVDAFAVGVAADGQGHHGIDHIIESKVFIHLKSLLLRLQSLLSCLSISLRFSMSFCQFNIRIFLCFIQYLMDQSTDDHKDDDDRDRNAHWRIDVEQEAVQDDA